MALIPDRQGPLASTCSELPAGSAGHFAACVLAVALEPGQRSRLSSLPELFAGSAAHAAACVHKVALVPCQKGLPSPFVQMPVVAVVVRSPVAVLPTHSALEIVERDSADVD